MNEIKEVSEEEIDFAAKVLMDRILEFRKEIDVEPIKCEPFSLNEAAELCSVGETGNMVSNLLSLQEQADRAALQDWFETNYAKILVLVIVLMVPLIYFILVSKT